VRGTWNYVPDRQRGRFESPEFLLMREPKNEHDASAVAIYSMQRLIGYVPSATAGTIAPLLDKLNDCDGFVVKGAADVGGTMPRFFVDLPTVPELRAYVKRQAGG
jgi:hypothetical protein